MLVAGSIKCGEFCKMPRPYSHDLRWRMVYQMLFYEKSYEEIALQLFVCPKTVYRTIRTFLNTGDVKPCRLGRPTGSITLFPHERVHYHGLLASHASNTATRNSKSYIERHWFCIWPEDAVSSCLQTTWNNAKEGKYIMVIENSYF